VWESAFFLVSLSVFLAVIYRALRAEARVLHEQDNFLALVSHQFKTPLASLQLSLETMSMRALSPTDQRSLIDRMLSDLARMEGLVTRILDSVRLERGRVTLRNEPIDLAAAVGRVVGQLSERAGADRVSFSVDVPKGLELLADPLAVDVVIRNLIENALANDRTQRAAPRERDRADGARLRHRFPARRQRTAVSEVLAAASRRWQQLLRHGARLVHRSPHDAARRWAR
jgi:hypothetical protein